MKYHVITFGCQMNTADSAKISAVLAKTGQETKNMDEADLVVVNMCSVRQSAVDRVHWIAQKIQKLKAKRYNLKAILTGCVLPKDKKQFEKSFGYILNISEAISFLERELAPRAERGGPPARKNLSPSEVGYVTIMNGCNNFCSYCVVPYTRGREVSRPAKEIIKEVKNLVKNGSKEIWLLGQNVNSYSNVLENNRIVNFPNLLKMVNDIPGKFELNFTSSHPKDFSDELIATMIECEKLSKKLNLPIQSGDDEVLKRMNRPYTIAQYKNLVKRIRKAIPDILLSTDVIVGFPGETKKQFNNTVKTFKEIGFSLAFINKYSPRAGTAAFKMKDNVPWPEKKRREKILIDLINVK